MSKETIDTGKKILWKDEGYHGPAFTKSLSVKFFEDQNQINQKKFGLSLHNATEILDDPKLLQIFLIEGAGHGRQIDRGEHVNYFLIGKTKKSQILILSVSIQKSKLEPEGLFVEVLYAYDGKARPDLVEKYTQH